MKRRRFALTVLAGIVATGVAVTINRHRESHRRLIAAREEYYKAALQSYTKSFTLGLARRVVEANLSERGVTFRQQCCIHEHTAYADLVRVGMEEAPWACRERNVYIAFEFAAMQYHGQQNLTASDTDILKRVTLYRQLEGCL